MATASQAPLLAVRGLRVSFVTPRASLTAVDGIDFDVAPGEVLGLAGESGSGKSITLRSILRLIKPPGRIAGEVRWRGRDLLRLPEAAIRRVRGGEIGMIFQEPMTALNPVLSVGLQIRENLQEHGDLDARGRRVRAIELLDHVGIPAAAARVDDYPHQFSGGMRQRVMITIALCCRPKLLIADEPTTALDVTIQAQVLDLIASMRRQLGMSVVLISHNLGVVAEYCDRVALMYAGQVVETGPTRAVIGAPRHPYTQGLLRSMPILSDPDRPIRPIAGQVPDLIDLPPECRFLPRCPLAGDECRQKVPLLPAGEARQARCVRIAA